MKNYSLIFLIIVLAQIALFFFPWLILENDVHLYTIGDIPKMSKEALNWFYSGLFTLPIFFLYASIVSLVVVVVLQLIEIISVFAGKPVSGGVIKAANFFAIAVCACAILMFISFWINLFFGFFPTPWLIIMPIALFCQLKFAKSVKSVNTVSRLVG